VKVESGKKTINEDVQVLNIDGKSTNNPQAIAGVFNEYFLSLVGKIYLNSNNNDNNINNNPIYYLSHAFNISYPNINLKFTTKEIENIIKSLKPKNSHGYDEISTNLLKTSSVYISSPLNHICNKSLSSGIFPQRLKYAVVKPLFKKGERSCISNYRPISLLTSFSKVFEKLYILDYLNT
jgi:Notch-like protein